MLVSPQTKLLLTHYYYSSSSKMFSSVATSKHLLLLKSTLISPTHKRILNNSPAHHLHFFHYIPGTSKNLIFSTPKHISPICQQAYGYWNGAMPADPPVNGVGFETRENEVVDWNQLKILRKKLDFLGVDKIVDMPGQHNNLVCPKCKGGDSGEKSFSIKIEENGGEASWNCFRGKCGWAGHTRAYAEEKSTYAEMSRVPKKMSVTKNFSEDELRLEPLGPVILKYFAERMISGETLRRNGVMQRIDGNQICIAFPYRRNNVIIGCKYRGATEKKFWQESHTEKIFYGLDDIQGANDIIIVEGEMDKLALEEAGFKNCVSVPDGAPATVSKKQVPDALNDTKYQYLWNCRDYTDKAVRIILATDSDSPGQALAEELARRLGKERCYRVDWPKKSDTGSSESYKDANEVLMYESAQAVRDAIQNAETYPIHGLFNFRQFFGEIDDYYNQSLGFELGISTGWSALDGLYNIVPGELTIVTGVPNSGKSEWIDALLVNLNRSVGWKFALCSMENKVQEHARKLLEKRVKKPFFDVRYGESSTRMSVEELEEGKKWLEDTFTLIRSDKDILPSTDWVLNLARISVCRHGVRGLVIDPYNELDHQRPPNQTETEYVSQMLTKMKRFAQHYSCHVWFVAHPRQLHNWTGGAPNLYDISGSAHFINKCDNGVVVHRNRDSDAGPLDIVQIFVRKVRNKVAGTIGDAQLRYERLTGEYMDVDQHNSPSPNKNR